MPTYIIHISSFQNALRHTCCSTGFYFKSRIAEGFHEMQKCYVFQLLGPLSQNVHFWCCTIFSCSTLIQLTQFLQWKFESIWLMFFDEVFHPPCNRCYYDWEFVFFLLLWKPLLRKQISLTQLCSLSSQTIPDKIGVKQRNYSKKIVAKAYLLPHCKGPWP